MVKGYRDYYTGEDKKDGNEEKQNQGRPRVLPSRQPHKPFIYTSLRRISTSTTKEIRVKHDRFGIDCALGGGPHRTEPRQNGTVKPGLVFPSHPLALFFPSFLTHLTLSYREEPGTEHSDLISKPPSPAGVPLFFYRLLIWEPNPTPARIGGSAIGSWSPR